MKKLTSIMAASFLYLANPAEIKSQDLSSHNPQETHLAAVLSLNNTCEKTYKEEAIVVTGSEKTIPVTVPGSSKTQFNGKNFKATTEIDLTKIMDISESEKIITIYHCHPPEMKVNGQAIPSQADISTAAIVSGIFYLIQPQGIISHRVVQPFASGNISVIEYKPKDSFRKYTQSYQKKSDFFQVEFQKELDKQWNIAFKQAAQTVNRIVAPEHADLAKLINKSIGQNTFFEVRDVSNELAKIMPYK